MTILDFKEKHMTDAHEINLMDELTLKGVTQFYAFVEERQKVYVTSYGDLCCREMLAGSVHLQKLK